MGFYIVAVYYNALYISMLIMQQLTWEIEEILNKNCFNNDYGLILIVALIKSGTLRSKML
jgi:hypothetical protein